MQIPRRKSEELNALKRRDDGPVYLTKDGARRLEERLARLRAALPGLISEAERTAAYGDRSENAEYKEAKGTLRRTHRQIYSIQDQLRRVAIIAVGSDSGKVQIGSTVVLEDTEGKKTFQILGTRESDPARGRISNKSPLGVALMGRAKGDVVTMKTPSGVREYRILEIR